MQACMHAFANGLTSLSGTDAILSPPSPSLLHLSHALQMTLLQQVSRPPWYLVLRTHLKVGLQKVKNRLTVQSIARPPRNKKQKHFILPRLLHVISPRHPVPSFLQSPTAYRSGQPSESSSREKRQTSFPRQAPVRPHFIISSLPKSAIGYIWPPKAAFLTFSILLFIVVGRRLIIRAPMNCTHIPSMTVKKDTADRPRARPKRPA